MAAHVPHAIIDLMLSQLQGTEVFVCSSQPVDRAAAVSGALATVAIDGSDYTLSNGDVSGRKITLAAQQGVNIDVGGTANHIVVGDGTTITDIAACDPLLLVAGGTLDIPAWDHEISDPS